LPPGSHATALDGQLLRALDRRHGKLGDTMNAESGDTLLMEVLGSTMSDTMILHLVEKADLNALTQRNRAGENVPMIACRVMSAGKDYFTDKTPFTALAQLDEARRVVAATGRKYAVYFSERLHVESAMYATDLVAAGAIGRVINVIGLGPHRLGAPSSRPAWFYQKAKYGGILCDIGSHQFEQFLTFTGATDATVTSAAVANYAHPDTPELEDFGEATLVGDNGATNYIRVDWFTPNGLRTWGDGRMVILGTEGYIELRKYVDIGRDSGGNQVFLVDGKGEHHLNVTGKVGFRFFGELILDCLHRTERAMTQAHAFKAAELCLKAQAAAQRIA
jgi:predicted dehydrogenase